MADQNPPQSTSTQPWPAPPPFYEHFTKQNAAALRKIRKETDAANGTSAGGAKDDLDRNIDILSLPPELRYLIPPPPPSDDKYRSFGRTIDHHAPSPSLGELGIEQLYPDHPSVRLNPQAHLISMARSLLTTFLSLSGVLSVNPGLYETRVDDLRTIVANMHDLINGYRPHQARETLIQMMEQRVEKLRAEIRAIEEGKVGVASLLQDIHENVSVPERREHDGGIGLVESKSTPEDGRRRTRQLAAWAALEEHSNND